MQVRRSVAVNAAAKAMNVYCMIVMRNEVCIFTGCSSGYAVLPLLKSGDLAHSGTTRGNSGMKCGEKMEI